jgi:hypothetical protein
MLVEPELLQHVQEAADTYGVRVAARRFRLRFDHHPPQKLETLRPPFQCSVAEVIHQLIAQAKPEDFSESWHLAVREHRQKGNA